MKNKKYASAIHSIALAGCVLTVFTVCAMPVLAAVDNLELAAKKSPNAQRSVLTAISRVDRRVVAVGERGIIIVSSDGARKWVQAEVPVSVTLTAVTFVNSNLGWAVGHDGVVLHTVNGGASWTKQFDGTQANALVRKSYEERVKLARAAADRQALEEAESALADATAGEAFGPSRPLLGVWFKNERQGFVVGAFGQIFRTRDGGKSWTFLGTRLENPSGLHLNAISGTASGVLMVAAEAGKVFRSDDDGESWRMSDTGYIGPLYGVLNLGGNTMDSVLAYGFGGKIFRSTNSGMAWKQVETDIKTSFVDALILEDRNVIMLAQDGTLLQSVDAAKTFGLIKPARVLHTSGMTKLPDGPGVISVGVGGVHPTEFGAPR